MPVFRGRPNLPTPADLNRLRGSEQAAPLLARRHAELSASVDERGPDATRNGVPVDACFPLGEDEQCQQAWSALATPTRAG